MNKARADKEETRTEPYHGLNPSEVQVETFRTGPVNTSNNAVHATHLPSGIVVHYGDHRSLHKNRKGALRILAERVKAHHHMVKDIQEAEDERVLEMLASLYPLVHCADPLVFWGVISGNRPLHLEASND